MLENNGACTARSTMYSLLSRCFADHVAVDAGDDVTMLAQVTDSDVRTFLSSEPAANAILVQLEGLSEVLASLGSDEPAAIATQREFALLFLLPTGVHPYESVYRDPERLLMGVPWREVRAFYRRCGLAVAEDEHHPEDHIASELAFMSIMSGGCAPESADLRQEQLAFLHQHLLTWVPQLAQRIRQHPKANFYRRIGDLLLSWVEFDASWLAGADA